MDDGAFAPDVGVGDGLFDGGFADDGAVGTRQKVGSPSHAARDWPSKIWSNPAWSLKSAGAGSWNREWVGGGAGCGAAGACAKAPVAARARKAKRRRAAKAGFISISPMLFRRLGYEVDLAEKSRRDGLDAVEVLHLEAIAVFCDERLVVVGGRADQALSAVL